MQHWRNGGKKRYWSRKNKSPPMKLSLVPAMAGLEWVRLGVRTFWRRPLPLTALFFAMTLVLSLLSHLPLIGTPVALALLPTVTQIMMLAAVTVHQGHPPSWHLGGRRLWPLLLLGLLYALCFFTVMALSSLMDGGQFALTYLGEQEITTEMAQSDEFRRAAGLALLLLLPLSITFWHAPGLVYWLDTPPIKALFFSLVACVRNVRAFVVYALAWAALLLGAGMAVSMLASLLTILGLEQAISQALIFLSLLVISAMFSTSVVFTLRACFEPPKPEGIQLP